MAKIKSFFRLHRIFFGLFVFLCFYSYAVGNTFAPFRVGEHFYSFYAVDYALGFCSRFLPGAIYRLFFKTVEPAVLTAYHVVLLLLFFAGLCLLLEKLLLSTVAADRPLCFFFVLLFLTGPASFVLFSKWLGVIDFYWLPLCLFCVAALSRRQLWPLIPLLFVSAVLVHYGALICYVPMMALMMLYRLTLAEDKKDRRLLGAVLIVSVAAALLLTLYFVLFERENIVCTMEEFDALMQSRGVKYTYYYDYNIFRYFAAAGEAPPDEYIYGDGNPLLTLLRSVWMQIRMSLGVRLKSDSFMNYVLALLVLCPPAGLICSVYLARFRDPGTRGFLLKAVYLLAPLCFLCCFIASFFFSSDAFRWLSHSFLPLMTVFLYISYFEKESLWLIVRRKLHTVPSAVLLVFLLVYAAVVMPE